MRIDIYFINWHAMHWFRSIR